ncbi:MAG TPA: hypothetical protein VFK44_09880 [Bacillales bacterium]|nr:hypothetical protein [Bacillales bacterium]
MKVNAARASIDRLKNLPTTARPSIDAEQVVVPEGYRAEVVMAGLSFPTGMTFAEDGTLYLNEGGSTWPTRPSSIPRILRLSPAGELDVFAEETLGGPRGLAYRDGYLYVSVKGGYHTRIVRYDVETREREVLFDQIPDGGWHEPGGPVFGPDGLLYFAQGSVAQQGVVLPQGYTVDLAKHPEACDVPGEDVTLTGNNVWSRDPLTPDPYLVKTGPFKPFGKAEKGEVVKGRLWCSQASGGRSPTAATLSCWRGASAIHTAWRLMRTANCMCPTTIMRKKVNGRPPMIRTGFGTFATRKSRSGRSRSRTGTAIRIFAATGCRSGMKTICRKKGRRRSRCWKIVRNGRGRRRIMKSRIRA